MSSASTEAHATASRFHTTHWTVVLAARKDGTTAQVALADLCSTYWYPLYAFVRRDGAGPHEAQDLTQEFFRQFLEKHSILHVRPAAGKFRSFLLTCLKNFLGHERERARAQRRACGQAPIPLEAGDAETRYALEPADPVTPELLFEKRWILALLERALQELCREYAERGKGEVFEELQAFLPGGQGSLSRADLAAKHGISINAVDVAIHRLRQRFGVLLRA
jgi:RNA polymerase sigma-70 factor (ECF subfamily)